MSATAEPVYTSARLPSRTPGPSAGVLRLTGGR